MTSGWSWLKPEEADFDAILGRLLREASEAIPGLSPDPRQADPVVVMLLQSFAREYAALYSLMDDSLGLAYRTLASRLLSFPHAPEPATTVLHFETKDSGARIPREFQAVAGRPVPLPGRRTAQVHFSPIHEGRISAFEVAALVMVETSGTATRLPDPPYPGLPERWQARTRATPALFIALDALTPTSADGVEVFIYGDPNGVRNCLWSTWQVPDRLGGAALEIHDSGAGAPLVPAQTIHKQVPYDPPLFSFRSDQRRLSSPYESQIVSIGGAPLLSQACAMPRELGESASALPPAHGVRHWVRIALGADAPLSAISGVCARTNSVLAANRELRSSGPQGGNETPLHSWVFPDDVNFDNLLAIERVLDLKSGQLFHSAATRDGLDAPRSYRVVEWSDRGTSRVRVDILDREEPRRRREFLIDYGLTLGAAANGLAAGTVSVAFTPAEVFPGLISVRNLVPSVGGRPARTPEQEMEELRSVLRSHGRAVVADDFVQMARAFDPHRIAEVELSRGVKRGPHGLRSSVVVTAHTKERGFVNVLEREAFRESLNNYLQDRCALGEAVEVRLQDDSE